jgi:hypothetical protein
MCLINLKTAVFQGEQFYLFSYSHQSYGLLAKLTTCTELLDRSPMIKINIWVFFIFYLIYALISVPLFLSTSDGWIAIFFYYFFANLYYIISSILLFLTAIFRTRRKRTQIKFKGGLLLKILGFQGFVVLFNYQTCEESLCNQGFLPTLLDEAGLPMLFAPPFVLVVFALLLYLILLSLFLLDMA